MTYLNNQLFTTVFVKQSLALHGSVFLCVYFLLIIIALDKPSCPKKTCSPESPGSFSVLSSILCPSSCSGCPCLVPACAVRPRVCVPVPGLSTHDRSLRSSPVPAQQPSHAHGPGHQHRRPHAGPQCHPLPPLGPPCPYHGPPLCPRPRGPP